MTGSDLLGRKSVFHRKEFKFIWGVGGVYGSYMYYGYLQEKLFSTDYSQGAGDRFTYSFSLILFQCILSWIVAKTILLTVYEIKKNKISSKDKLKMGVFNLSSMLLSNTALMYVSYPVQALIKSCKILSVILVGLIYGGKKFSKVQYAYVTLITAGIIVFNLTADGKKKKDQTTSWIGIVLCVASLLSDGLLADTQDTCRKEVKPSGYELMEACASWAAILCFAYSLVTFQLIPFVDFCTKYPTVIPDIITISIMGTIGQIFIFYVIAHFSPLVLSVVTTTRKFFTVLASIVIYNHAVNGYQWLSMVMVFAGVAVDLVYGIVERRRKHHEAKLDK